MERAADMLVQNGHSQNRFIVALTDGYSGHSPVGTMQRVDAQLHTEAYQNVSVITIAVNMKLADTQQILDTCVRSDRDCMISADGGMEALRVAWRDAGNKLTVSEKIELANVSDEECLHLLERYIKLNSREPKWSKQKQAHWVSYMHRRVHILKGSEKFNKNEQFQNFGSTTMRVMLEEAGHALSDDYRRDWGAIEHEQFIYWQDEHGDFKWSIIATKPSMMSAERKALLASLDMHVPSQKELYDHRVLHSYLAAGLGVEVQNRQQEAPFEIELGTLRAIEDSKFVLTLDFAMKMLCMFERIACGAPCIMEGETGVSKTALTRMLFILLNKQADGQPGSNPYAAFATTVRDALGHVVTEHRQAHGTGMPIISSTAVAMVLRRIALDVSETNREAIDDVKLLSRMRLGLLETLKADPGLDARPDDVAAAVGGEEGMPPGPFHVPGTGTSAPRNLFAWYVGELLTQMQVALTLTPTLTPTPTRWHHHRKKPTRTQRALPRVHAATPQRPRCCRPCWRHPCWRRSQLASRH